MDAELMNALGNGGAYAAAAFAAFGSSLGTGYGAASAIGAWKRCYAQNQIAPMLLAAFIGAPLSQTIYGFVLMGQIQSKVAENPAAWPMYLIIGITAGLAMGASAAAQGKAAAGACDAQASTGKGFTNYLLALGIVETVALFAMVFGMMAL
jgi:V/A-type H+-transporting ATPase subunit K